MKAICQAIIVLIASAGLVACGGSSNSGETGLLSLGVSDDPIHDAKKVCIAFDAVELKPAGDGPAFRVPLPETNINLLDFQGMNAAPLLYKEEVPAGEYAWMRLIINAVEGNNGGAGDSSEASECAGDASYMVMGKESNTTMHNLYIPSGDESGLKLGGFTVPVNGSVDYTAEWDLMLSITEPPGLDSDVILKPHVKLVDNTKVGTLRGSVSNERATADRCEPAVYVFDNNTDASDIGVGEPAASAIVSPFDETDLSLDFEYEIGYLLEGTYEAAFTCDGGETFLEPAEGNPFIVVVGDITRRNFQ